VRHNPWVIERLVPGGQGFARLDDGQVGFVAGALPGDHIAPTQIDERRGYRRAVRWTLVKPASERVVPPCSIASSCGGCDLMHLARPAQLSSKSEMLREALLRTGGFHELPDPLPMVSVGSDLGYRNRLRLHIAPTGQMGLYARGSHELVEVPECRVSNQELNAALARMRDVTETSRSALAQFSEVEIRVAPGGPRVLLLLWPRGRRLPLRLAARTLVQTLKASFAVVVVGHAGGEHYEDQRWPLPEGTELCVPPAGFAQINWQVNIEIVRRVLRDVKARSITSFLELYSGAGNFTLPLAAAGLSGVAIEKNVAAIEALRRAATRARVSTIELVVGNVEHELERFLGERRAFDLVLLNPPRSGARRVLPQVARFSPEYIAICSCDPVTLARDLRTLAELGYSLQSVTGFDMFPHTHHVEALAFMRRGQRTLQAARTSSTSV